MKPSRLLSSLLACATIAVSTPIAASDGRPRLCILTDIGGDPDDQQSLIRLLAYANAFRLEGLLATSSGSYGQLQDSSPRTDLIHQIVDAYAEVLPRFRHHAPPAALWPEPAALREIIHPGKAARGIDAIGPGHDTPASGWLIQRIDAGSPDDPLNISIWGGQTDLAQALWQVAATRSPADLAAFTARFRVFDINDQDRIAGQLRRTYPKLRYILAEAAPGHDKREGSYRGMYLGGDESLTSADWVETHIRSTGPLGALYPTKTWTAPNPHGCLKEGDTPSWFFFLPAGGNDPDDPSKPGWGGQFQRAPDGWWVDLPAPLGHEARDTVNIHRPAFQDDFARRMAWCREEHN